MSLRESGVDATRDRAYKARSSESVVLFLSDEVWSNLSALVCPPEEIGRSGSCTIPTLVQVDNTPNAPARPHSKSSIKTQPHLAHLPSTTVFLVQDFDSSPRFTIKSFVLCLGIRQARCLDLETPSNALYTCISRRSSSQRHDPSSSLRDSDLSLALSRHRVSSL